MFVDKVEAYITKNSEFTYSESRTPLIKYIIPNQGTYSNKISLYGKWMVNDMEYIQSINIGDKKSDLSGVPLYAEGWSSGGY